MFKSRKPKPPPEFWTIEKACAAVEAAQEIADDHPLPGSIVHRARLSQVRFAQRRLDWLLAAEERRTQSSSDDSATIKAEAPAMPPRTE